MTSQNSTQTTSNCASIDKKEIKFRNHFHTKVQIRDCGFLFALLALAPYFSFSSYFVFCRSSQCGFLFFRFSHFSYFFPLIFFLFLTFLKQPVWLLFFSFSFSSSFVFCRSQGAFLCILLFFFPNFSFLSILYFVGAASVASPVNHFRRFVP